MKTDKTESIRRISTIHSEREATISKLQPRPGRYS